MSIWVLFDLDGTLVDNSEGITKSTQFALDSYGYPNQPMETLKKFIGPRRKACTKTACTPA